MPTLDRLRSGIAAHADRKAGEASPARPLLAEGDGEDLASRIYSVSSRLTQGPITTDVGCDNGCGYSYTHNKHLWLWVPALRSRCSLGRDDIRESFNDFLSLHTPPASHPLALRRRHQWPLHACARSRLRDTRPPVPAAAARLSRDGLFLAQGNASSRRGRLSRDRAGPTRLWPHHG